MAHELLQRYHPQVHSGPHNTVIEKIYGGKNYACRNEEQSESRT